MLARRGSASDAGSTILFLLPRRLAHYVRSLMAQSASRWGVIGAGAFAAEVILPSMASVVDIYAVASSDETKRRSLSAKLQASVTYSDYESLLADPEITHVYVGVP